MPDHDRSRWANRRAPDRDPWREHDACGVGCVARASGERSSGIVAPAGGRHVDAPAWERSLYLARRIMEQRIAAAGPELAGFFACSLSCRTVVYKALLTGTQLPGFFPDLVSPDFESAIAVFHQ